MYFHLVIVRRIAIPGLRRIIGGANTGPVRESVVGEFRLRLSGGERTSRVATVVRVVVGGVFFIAVRRQDERPVLYGDHGGTHCLLEKRNERARKKKKRAVVGKKVGR